MEKFPNCVLKEPQPQVFLTGQVENEPDLHTRIIKIIDSNIKDGDNTLRIAYRTVPNDHSFPEKKQFKDQISTDGILKQTWMNKHFENIPSVVVLIVSFSSDYGSTEWIRRETAIQERMHRLRVYLNPREIKIIVLVFKVGVQSLDKEIVDERINSLKKHLQLDSKTFYFTSPNELNVIDSATCKKFSKTIKDFSTAHYNNYIKHMKSTQKSISEKFKGPVEHLLNARYHFKVAYFYTFFRNQESHTLKYYKQCYYNLQLCTDNYSEATADQIKTIAEIVNFKICNLLLQSNQVNDAFFQFKLHSQKFFKLYSDFAWAHYAWIADQYVVFVQLLEKYAVNDNLADADRAYYYHNAAKYSQKRQISFDRIRADVEMWVLAATSQDNYHKMNKQGRSQTAGLFRGYLLAPPLYVGGTPQLLDPNLDQKLQFNSNDASSSEEQNKLIFEYLQEQELKVNHSNIIMGLLKLALDRINPNYKRRKAFIQSIIAQQYIKESNYQSAISSLLIATEHLISENWLSSAVSLLGLITNCAILLGRTKDYLNASLILYANHTLTNISRHELEDIHLNILNIFNFAILNKMNNNKSSTSTSPSHRTKSSLTNLVHNRANFVGDSFTAIFDRVEFAQYAPDKQQPQHYNICYTPSATLTRSTSSSNIGSSAASMNSPKPVFSTNISGNTTLSSNANAHRYTIDMTTSLMSMFDVTVNFAQPSVELGQSVLVSVQVQSKFVDVFKCQEMHVFFTDNAVVKRFVHVDTVLNDIETISSTSAGAADKDSNPVVSASASVTSNINTATHPKSAFYNTTPLNTNAKTLESGRNDDVIETPLLFLPKSSTKFDFYVYLSEKRFAKFVSNDGVVCIERIELVMNLPVDNSGNGVADADATTNGINIHTSSSMDHNNHNQIVFNVATLPDVVSKTRRNPGKSLSTKDLIKYCCGNYTYSPMLVISKPKSLVTLLKPIPVSTSSNTMASTSVGGSSSGSGSGSGYSNTKSTTVQLLTNIIQRVDLRFDVGDCDMLSASLFLSADFVPPTLSDALFWYPDTRVLANAFTSAEIQQLHQQHYHNPEKLQTLLFEKLDHVPFYPISVSSSMQPTHSLFLGSELTANSIITVPIFLKSNIAIEQVQLKFVLEYIPKGILKSSIAQEFIVKAAFHNPFELDFRFIPLSSDSNGIVLDKKTTTIISNERLLLKVSIHCLESLQHSLEVVGLQLNTTAHCKWIRNILALHTRLTPDITEDIDDNSAVNYQQLFSIQDDVLEFKRHDQATAKLKQSYDLLRSYCSAFQKLNRLFDTSNSTSNNTDVSITKNTGISDIVLSTDHCYSQTIQLNCMEDAVNFLLQHKISDIPGIIEILDSSHKFSTVLNKNDNTVTILHDQHDGDVNTSSVMNANTAGVCHSSIPIGDIVLQWKTLQRHVLWPTFAPLLATLKRNKCACGQSSIDADLASATLQLADIQLHDASFGSSANIFNVNTDWLYSFHDKATTSASPAAHLSQYLETDICTSAVSSITMRIPPVKIQVPPISIQFVAPSTTTLGDVFTVKALLQNKVRTCEKVKLVVSLNENFLIAGNTYCVLQIPTMETLELLFKFVPLSCGLLSLPPILVTWESAQGIVVKIIDIGEPQNKKFVFVRP